MTSPTIQTVTAAEVEPTIAALVLAVSAALERDWGTAHPPPRRGTPAPGSALLLKDPHA